MLLFTYGIFVAAMVTVKSRHTDDLNDLGKRYTMHNVSFRQRNSVQIDNE